MRRQTLASLAYAATLTAALAAPAAAAWTHDPVFGGVPVSNAIGSAGSPVMMADGSGGAFLAWSDYRSNWSQVYVQHLSAYGVALWTPNGVACASLYGAQETSPVLESDGLGGVIVAWADNRSGFYDIYAQRVTSGGAVAWAALGVPVCTAAGDQTQPAIVTDDANGAYIVWADSRTDGGDLYYNRVNLPGAMTFASATAAPLAVATGIQAYPHVVRDAGGGFIAAWQDQRGGTYDIYAARVNSAGSMQWSGGNIAVCNAAGDQTVPTLVADGTGGVIIAWQDARTNANGDVYAQRVYYGGLALWTSNGVALSTGGTTHRSPIAASDGASGAIVVWGDTRAGYTGPAAQRVGPGGATVWTAGGLTISGGVPLGPYSQYCIAPDGVGGAVIVYQDARAYWTDTWAVRYSAIGVATWGATGVAVNTNAAQDDQNAICGDGRGGAIVAIVDERNAGSALSTDLLAWHIDSYGIMGAEPVIASVKDVPNDNGGHVKVSWYASPLEADPASVGVTEYLVFRSAPPNLVARAQRAGLVTTSLDAVAKSAPGSRPLLALPDGVNTYFWELADQQNAYHLPTYSVVAMTSGDSMGVGNPKTAFLVEAHNTVNGDYWSSAPDSGYSTDNVPPIVPAPFMGTYAAGTATLHWNPNPEADLANYRIYRGATASFVANAGSLVATPPDTGYVDAAGAPSYYKLTAVDIHGNESPAAALLPMGTLGVGGTEVPRELALAAPSPNPARGAARIAFELPRATHVRLTVFDAGGRRVRTLADGPREAGAQAITFDLRDDRGRALGAGLYLVRLEAEGRAITRRFAAVR